MHTTPRKPTLDTPEELQRFNEAKRCTHRLASTMKQLALRRAAGYQLRTCDVERITTEHFAAVKALRQLIKDCNAD